MTNEESIHWLEVELHTWESECKSYHAVKDALKMAINSLKAWEKVKTKIRKGKFAEKKGLSERSLIYANGWEDGLEVAISIIDKYLRQEIEE